MRWLAEVERTWIFGDDTITTRGGGHKERGSEKTHSMVVYERRPTIQTWCCTHTQTAGWLTTGGKHRVALLENTTADGRRYKQDAVHTHRRPAG
ncbi:hypothetical protein ACOMHN_054771 [Nucella lapillus]